MDKLNIRATLSCAASLTLLLCAPPLMAQDNASMQRIEVRHQLPVTTACPTVRTQLAENLERTWAILDTPTEFQVAFQLDGDRVSNIKVSGGEHGFRAPVRGAVRRLSCTSPDSASHTVRFIVKFVYPEDLDQARQAKVGLDDLPYGALIADK